MTTSQEKAIERIRRLVEKEMKGIRGDKDCYEIKEWDLSEYEYFVSLVVEYGMKGDEGTLGEVFGRNRAQLFIGKKGGITYPVTKVLKNGEYKHYTKHFKGYSILQAVCDQM